ncbi:hypothetical protein H0H81_004224 [Sphagnurus paluster]|uniref:Uncharacterized protein n=1 Tax=Sphagnurus paluster TaxID=117069 RepID=A0A9P7K5C3_9AGAR|nr:hypothetical protein H0H81_004224 [Sphagnurus paluster]
MERLSSLGTRQWTACEYRIRWISQHGYGVWVSIFTWNALKDCLLKILGDRQAHAEPTGLPDIDSGMAADFWQYTLLSQTAAQSKLHRVRVHQVDCNTVLPNSM